MSFIREIGEGIRGLGSIAVLLFMEQLQATGKPDQYLKYEKKRAIMNVDPYIQIMPTRSKTFEQFPVILKSTQHSTFKRKLCKYKFSHLEVSQLW